MTESNTSNRVLTEQRTPAYTEQHVAWLLGLSPAHVSDMIDDGILSATTEADGKRYITSPQIHTLAKDMKKLSK